jgi:hypothetical protein
MNVARWIGIPWAWGWGLARKLEPGLRQEQWKGRYALLLHQIAQTVRNDFSLLEEWTYRCMP